MRQSEVLTAVGKYLAEHPEELARVVRKALSLRLGVPLAAVRWAATRRTGPRLPSDILVEAVPPGLRATATLQLMGARMRAASTVFVERVRLTPEELRLELRFSETQLTPLGESRSPLGALIQSGALDLSKLGDLVALMPKRPEWLLEAGGDRIVVDLRRHPALSTQRADLLLRLITPVVTVTAIGADSEHLDLKLGLFQGGVRAAYSSIRDLL